jgi:hypothetical protein
MPSKRKPSATTIKGMKYGADRLTGPADHAACAAVGGEV